MTETKTREPLVLSPLEDEPAIENLPEPIPLTPEQLAAQAEAEEQDRLRRLHWAMINRALSDNAQAVTRAMRSWYPREGDRERQTERVMTRYEDGSFLINRLGAEGVIDQDLVVVLLDLRRRLIGEYGASPSAIVLIDRAVAAYQDFIRITGWTGNTALMVEHEFFGRDRPCFEFRDRSGRGGREIRGLTVEEYINRLGQDLIPLAERCGRVMREALAALETVRAIPSSVGRFSFRQAEPAPPIEHDHGTDDAMPQRSIDHRGWGCLRVLLYIGAFALSFSHLAMASDVTAPIEQLDAGLLQVMKAGKGTPFQQRYDVLAPLVTRAVDLDDILQGGVGPTWASLPPAQQAALKTAFQRYSIATYVSHFDEFAGERFDLFPPPAAGNPVVRVKIVPGKPGDDTHILGYTMRQTPAGWKAVDVTADSTISQVAAQRDEIRSLVGSSGADGLLARLKQKTTELSGGSVR